MERMRESDFEGDSDLVARDLIGRQLVRKLGRDYLRGMIVETVAFKGYGKRTANREGIERGPGKVYIMPFRGNHFLNVATGEEGSPACVQVRALYGLEGIGSDEASGPGKLSKALEIDMSLDGESIEGNELFIEGDPASPGRVKSLETTSPNSIGRYRLQV